MKRAPILVSILLALLVLPPIQVGAHETDQFTLPPMREMADLGPHMTAWAYGLLDRAVHKVNDQIRRRIEAEGPDADLSDLYEQAHIVSLVNGQLPWAADVISGLDRQAQAESTRAENPGLVTSFRPKFNDVYSGAGLPFDPRGLIRLIFAPTVKIYGIHLGTDKVGHFTDMGMNYYRSYRGAIRGGDTREEAIKYAVRDNLANPIFSESGFLGLLTAGSYSNADLVSNYCGFLLYLNTTEPVLLKGELRPPLLVRDGVYWKLNSHVRRDSDFFSWFFSEHWDETLNPSVFDGTLRSGIRKNIRQLSGNILQRHADPITGYRRPQAWFAAKHKELETYWGFNYGHKGKGDELIRVSDVCFEKVNEKSKVTDRDRTGDTPLHTAAASGDVALVQKLIERGADVNARVVSGEVYSSEWGSTPLHFAARDGNVAIAEALIKAGASTTAVDARGATPLHRAVRHPAMVDLLMRSGATLAAVDQRGRSVLHHASMDPQTPAEVIAKLLDAKAEINQADHSGCTALHHAAATGSATAVQTLIQRGALAGAEDMTGATPLHLAARRDSPFVASVILTSVSKQALANIEDDFGRTPLHDAAARGTQAAVETLLGAGADANAADAFGVTPLHLAARHARSTVAAVLIDKGAKPDALSSSGTTPVHEASLAEDSQTLALLVKRGANTTVKDRRGQTPADLARGKNRDELLAALKSGPSAPTP